MQDSSDAEADDAGDRITAAAATNGGTHHALLSSTKPPPEQQQQPAAPTSEADWDAYDPFLSPAQPSSSSPLYLGIDLSSSSAITSSELSSLLSSALSAPFDYSLFPLSPPPILASASPFASLSASAPTLSPLAFPSATFNTNFFALLPLPLTAALVSPSSSSRTVIAAAARVKDCFTWYQHLSISTVVIAPFQSLSADGSIPSASPSPQQVSRCIFSALLAHPYLSIVLALPVTEAALCFHQHVLQACDHHRRLLLAPLLSASLPSLPLLHRLRAEQLRFLLLSTSAFVSNSRGFPVLPSAHRAAVLLLLRYCTAIVLSPSADSDESSPASLVYHQHFLHHLHSTSLPTAPADSSHRDYLQAPLQPLHDDLENQTYEVFERDAVKYAQYQQAITRALLQLRRRAEEAGEAGRLSVWVVGAGRGPLVTAVLAASTDSAVPVHVTAFEKNPHALYTLQLLSERWQQSHPSTPVMLLPDNILSFTPSSCSAPPPLPLLIVSELLGSWGDNELSPECLDAACRWLREGGLCIPERSVSWLVPVRDANVTGQLMAGAGVGAGGGAGGKESGYVVQLHACERVSEEDGRVVFVFVHPKRTASGEAGDEEQEEQEVREEEQREERRLRRADGCPLPTDDEDEAAYLSTTRTAASHPPSFPSSNSRYRELSFNTASSPSPSLVTGLACYFTARLHSDLSISTFPPTATPGMGSWFPLYLPLRAPLWLPAGAQLRVRLWRVAGEGEGRRVWYEWQVQLVSKEGAGELIASTHIHNAAGVGQSIGL